MLNRKYNELECTRKMDADAGDGSEWYIALHGMRPELPKNFVVVGFMYKNWRKKCVRIEIVWLSAIMIFWSQKLLPKRIMTMRTESPFSFPFLVFVRRANL